MLSGEALTQGFLTSRGYFSPELWDVYWANRQVCVRTPWLHAMSRILVQLCGVAAVMPEQLHKRLHKTQACMRALPHTRPGQRVSCLPGTTALSRKGRLVGTLLAAYGSGAFGIIPRTFLLPQQYWDWRLWVADMVCGSLSAHPRPPRRLATCKETSLACYGLQDACMQAGFYRA